jgi:UPF0755 protein
MIGKKNINLHPDSVAGIITQLHQKGYDVGIIDKYLLEAIGKPISGRVYIGTKHIDRLSFLYRITSKRAHYKIATLIPGETTYFFIRALARDLDMNITKLEDFYEQYSPFGEAGILADSYHVALHLREKGIIKLLLNISQKKYKKMSKQYLGAWNPKEWERILTIASVIQKEAANEKEMPMIASVIYNRITKHMRLQMDGTLNYGQYSHTRVTPKRIKNDHTTYNTYKHRGLPEQPVCNVSISAIKASLDPIKSNYLYFMKNDHGAHDFSVTYKTHLKNVHERKDELKKQLSK